MIQVTVLIKDGVRSDALSLDLPELGPDELARVEDLLHEVTDRINRMAAIRLAKARAAQGGDGPSR